VVAEAREARVAVPFFAEVLRRVAAALRRVAAFDERPAGADAVVLRAAVVVLRAAVLRVLRPRVEAAVVRLRVVFRAFPPRVVLRWVLVLVWAILVVLTSWRSKAKLVTSKSFVWSLPSNTCL
jgi:hypothetical protein